MACCDKQFHGLDDVMGCKGIMDLKMGDDTGVPGDDDDATTSLPGGVGGRSGEGGRRRIGVSGTTRAAARAKNWGGKPATDLVGGLLPGLFNPGRISTRAPA